MRVRRTRHLIFLAHIWACAPFVVAWYFLPEWRQENRPDVLGPLQVMVWVIAAGLVVRTVLAWYDPPWLPWDYLFPVADLVVISVALYLRRQPDSVLMMAYLFPIAEAASTLTVRWARRVGLLTVVAAALATSQQTAAAGPLEAGFRIFLLFIISTLIAWMAHLGAQLRTELTVAADRNQMALEMHDGVQGQLITIASRLELARRVAVADPSRAGHIAGEARDLARQAADELRFLVQRLRSPELHRGFLPALRQYAHHLGSRNDLVVDVRVEGEEYPLDPEAEHALFRILQECLNNTLKHARATEVTVTVAWDADVTRCVICDNGIGFDPGSQPALAEEHCGLESMRERLRRLGGELGIESGVGVGTMVTARVPRAAGRGRRRCPAGIL